MPLCVLRIEVQSDMTTERIYTKFFKFINYKDKSFPLLNLCSQELSIEHIICHMHYFSVRSVSCL